MLRGLRDKLGEQETHADMDNGDQRWCTGFQLEPMGFWKGPRGRGGKGRSTYPAKRGVAPRCCHSPSVLCLFRFPAAFFLAKFVLFGARLASPTDPAKCAC